MNRREFIRTSMTGVIAGSTLTGGLAPAQSSSQSPGGQPSRELYSPLRRPLTLALDGEWHFKEDPKEVGEAEEWFRPGKVRGRASKVPVPWQLEFLNDLSGYSGTAWYEKTFELPKEYAGKRVVLGFEAVQSIAKVWVNGRLVGGHEGGQTPFLLEISDAVRAGTANTVTVKATDPPTGMSFFLDTHSLLHGVSGIWRHVRLQGTGRIYVADIFVVPKIDESRAEARIRIAGSPPGAATSLRLRLVLKAPNGQEIAHEQPVDLSGLVFPMHLDVTVPVELKEVSLWELDDPKLYGIQASLLDAEGRALDTAASEFGMRKIEARGDRIYLNNRPVFVVGGGLDPGPYGGAVDINWHLPPPYALPSDEQIQHDIRTIKSMRVNFVRVPLRPADPRFLYWADHMGLMVMQGGPWTPTEGIGNAAGFERYKRWWSEAVLRDRNHPSVVLWELFNESFGMSWDSFHSIAGELYEHVKELDPTRFVLDNAGGWDLNELNYINNHGRSDITDVHSYPGFPVACPGHNDETRYPPDAQELWRGLRSYGKPVLVTEFGPCPYIFNVDKVKEKWGGKAPWWFNARAKRSAMPAQWDQVGFEERFYRWGLDEIYGNFTKFTELSDWYYFHGLKHQTELMRMNPEVTGFVPWLFDSAPHPIGSIDFYKDKKIYCDELARSWTQDVVMIENTRQNFWAGETLRANVHVSHFGRAGLKQASVDWWLDGTEIRGTVDGITMEPGEVRRVGEIVFRTPEVEVGKSLRLYAKLTTGHEVLSENWKPIQIFPLRDRQPLLRRVNFVGFDRSRFQALGYDVPAARERPSHAGMGFDPHVPIAVALSLQDPSLRQYLQDGATVILMVCDDSNYWMRRPVPQSPPIQELFSRNDLALGSRFQGGHSDSFFIRRTPAGPFSRIPFENPIHWPFYKVWPNHSIIGLQPADRSDILAGAYGNLIRSVPMDPWGKQRWSEVNGCIAQFRCGKGRLIISTFELVLPCLDDPVAAVMLHDLIAYSGTYFQPKREFVLS